MASIKLVLLLAFVGYCICDNVLFEATTWPEVIYNVESLKEEQLWNTELFDLERCPEYSGVGVYNWRTGNSPLVEFFNWAMQSGVEVYDSLYFRNLGSPSVWYLDPSDYFGAMEFSLPEEPEGTFAAIIERGSIRIAYDPENAEAFMFEVDEDGNPAGGFWFDWLNYSVEQLSEQLETEIEIEWVQIPYFYQVIALDDAAVDAVFDVPKYGSSFWSAMEQFFEVQYTAPLLLKNLGWSLSDHAVEEHGIHAWTDLDDSQFEVAVGSESFAAEVEMWIGEFLPNATLVTFDSLLDAGYALHTGKVDAMFGDSASLGRVQKQYNRATYQGTVTPYFTRHVAVRGDNECDSECTYHRTAANSLWQSCA